MKRLLIISPHFPPSSTADMQRIRMLLPFFKENGWLAEVLAVMPDQVASPFDPWLAKGLPKDVPVHRVKAMGLRWSRLPGLGTLGLRALRALRRAGDSLLGLDKFDLVYFSTTVFEVHILGPRWQRKYGVPFVMDYQDPWVNDYYREHPGIVPPGGRLKYSLVDKLHRWMEPRVLRECAGITSVSPEYPVQLKQRYPWLDDLPNLVQPFPGAMRDFDRIAASEAQQTVFDPHDGYTHWVYVGVIVPGMLPVLRALFLALTRSMNDDFLSKLRIHFIGTSYTSGVRAFPQVVPLARDFGFTDQVQEITDRIPYVEALKCLSDADALIAVGSDDEGYTASKMYPYLLAKKPLLAAYHENSSIVDIICKVGGAVCVPFVTPLNEERLENNFTELWLSDNQFLKTIPLNESVFEAYTDRGRAAELCQFLLESFSNA